MKPIKKIYADIHKKILQDIEEDGINLGYILGPQKSPGQVIRVTDFRSSVLESQIDGETKDYSLLTGAMVYYDNDDLTPAEVVEDDENTPKKLVKKVKKRIIK